MACAEGIVRNANSNMPSVSGGHILITKDWAKILLHRMGFVKRGASNKAKVSVEDFEEKKEQFLLDIKAIVTLEDIPLDSNKCTWERQIKCHPSFQYPSDWGYNLFFQPLV